MALWGLLLIAIGLGALLGISLWPLVLVVFGVALLVGGTSGKSGRRDWYWWCCTIVPQYREHYERRQGETNGEPYQEV